MDLKLIQQPNSQTNSQTKIQLKNLVIARVKSLEIFWFH